MKLKTSAAQKSETSKKIKSPKKQSKGVEIRKEKSKDVVKQSVLKKEAKKCILEVSSSPSITIQQDLWFKAIDNVSNQSNLSDQESSIVKLLSNYKNKSSIPQKKTKLKNFITKGFSKYKDTSDETLDGIYDKLFEEYKAVGGNTETVGAENNIKKSEKKVIKTKSINKKVSKNEEMDIGDGDDEDDVDDDDVDDDDDDDDDAESIEFGDSNDDVEEESEEEKLKPIAKKNIKKNGKSQPVKAKNGSTFKSGKIQKNKKFGKKK